MQWWCAAQDTAWSWAWRAYPGVWLFVASLGLGLVALHRRFPEPDGELTPGLRRALAASGLALLWIALDWPVGALGSGYLASVHMVQFLLIAVAAPPLLLLGVPRDAWKRAVSRPMVGGIARVVGYPIFSMAFFAVVMGFTHWPAVVDGLMSSQVGSLLLDLMWLGSGLIFWWPVAVALPERDWLREPFKMGYLVAATLVNTGVFAFLTFSDVPLYATFELAPPVGTLSTRDDQLVAGLLMKLGGAVILWTSITVLWFRWFNRSEREDVAERRGRAARTSVMVLLVLMAGSWGCGASESSIEGVVAIGESVTGDRAALYLTIRGGRAADRLVGLEVEGVEHASLHETTQVDGMMRMEAAPDGFEIGPGETLRLRPGGRHGMLEGVAMPLMSGDSVRVTLRLTSRDLEVWAHVVALADLESVLER